MGLFGKSDSVRKKEIHDALKKAQGELKFTKKERVEAERKLLAARNSDGELSRKKFIHAVDRIEHRKGDDIDLEKAERLKRFGK